MRNLKRTGFADALREAVFGRGRPILGICLGMQVMARKGHEGGAHDGLGWLEAEVKILAPSDPSLRVPQIGWNDIAVADGLPLFSGIPAGTDFYFVHSYAMHCSRGEDVAAVCEYGGPVTAAVLKGNIFATQFHPEKSQDRGLRVLTNFLRWNP
jgi:glutamine amidotransferase